MGLASDFVRDLIAKVIAWTFTIVVAMTGIEAFFLYYGHELKILENMSKIPFVGWIFLYPTTTVIVCFILFVLMFRGNALPKYVYSLFRPAQ